MKKLLLPLVAAFAVTLFSCKKDEVETPAPTPTVTRTASMQATGLLKRLEVSTFMYGTHILIMNTGYYALKSTTVNLDQYVNQNVTITGNRIAGYPVDGGPPYIDVITVQ